MLQTKWNAISLLSVIRFYGFLPLRIYWFLQTINTKLFYWNQYVFEAQEKISTIKANMPNLMVVVLILEANQK